MRILAIDTATEACSAALWNDGNTCAHFELCPREHTQRILPIVQDWYRPRVGAGRRAADDWRFYAGDHGARRMA